MSGKHKQTIRNYLKYYYYGSYNNERVTLAFSAIKAVNTNGAKNNTLNANITIIYNTIFTTIPVTLNWNKVNLHYMLVGDNVSGTINNSNKLTLIFNNDVGGLSNSITFKNNIDYLVNEDVILSPLVPPILDGKYDFINYWYGSFNGVDIELERPTKLLKTERYDQIGFFVKNTQVAVAVDVPLREKRVGVWEKTSSSIGNAYTWQLRLADSIRDNGEWTINPTLVIDNIIYRFDCIYIEKGYNSKLFTPDGTELIRESCAAGTKLQTPLVSHGFAIKQVVDDGIDGDLILQDQQVDLRDIAQN